MHTLHMYTNINIQILNTIINGVGFHYINMLMKKMNVKLLDMCKTSQLMYSFMIGENCNK